MAKHFIGWLDIRIARCNEKIIVYKPEKFARRLSIARELVEREEFGVSRASSAGLGTNIAVITTLAAVAVEGD